MTDVRDAIFDSAGRARLAAAALGWEQTVDPGVWMRDDEAIELAQDKQSRAWCWSDIR
jgi:hypothetical protein